MTLNGVAMSDIMCTSWSISPPLTHSALTCRRRHLRHAPLSEVDLVGLAPDLEVAELLDGEPVGKHQHHVLLVVLSYPHLHLGIGSAKKTLGACK